MSTATLPTTLAPRDIAGPTIGRLTAVELRKASDTRSGRWLLGLAVLVTIAVTVARGFIGAAEDRTLTEIIALSHLPFSIFLPIIGILLVTGEWSQRTALTTFALVPDRRRVIAAKLLAALTLSATGLATALLAAVVVTAAAGVPGAWDVGAGDLGQVTLAVLLGMLWGVAFGLVLRTSAAAIVAYFALPTVFGLLGELVTALQSTWTWLDPNLSLVTLSEMRLSGDGWWHLLTACSLWIALPLVVGTALLLRREVK
ncbi:ABC transporter permease subunit [Conexibacter sp. W3-3-2]|uniref:ABC transporter permease subunit n=1 Tax=Conexibacter sp. W3-3-2 TaxID=2675227 RepID=UPI0012B6E0D5|nr:ABC transporter permease subunit [Conexibacter sp. W3-3-2]MTD44496.1 ABC transporter permease subunit [Conexibacter sp. W3-3-2]